MENLNLPTRARNRDYGLIGGLERRIVHETTHQLTLLAL